MTDDPLDLQELIAKLDPRCESCGRRGRELVLVHLDAERPFRVCHPCDIGRRA